MSRLFILFSICFIACHSNSFRKKTYKETYYYKGTNKVNSIFYLANDSSTLDSSINFSLNGDTINKLYFAGDTLNHSLTFVNNKLVKKTLLSGVVEKYRNNKISKIHDMKNRCIITYYSNEKIKKLLRYNYDHEDYYFNEYDSLSGHLTKCYRYIDESFKITDDSIIMTPSLENNMDKIENYSFIIVEHDEKGIVKNTHLQKGKSPRFALKYEKNKMWTKIICDSIGCFSLPITFYPKETK